MRRLFQKGSLVLLAGAQVALVLIAPLAVPNARADDKDLWALLKKPGHFLLLRHSNAPGDMPEPNNVDLKNCLIQRNLDEAGRAQAGRIGDEFRKHGIIRVRLISSQFCRALETAKLTKLGPVQELSALNMVYRSEPARMKTTAEKTSAFMKSVSANQLVMFVTHVDNILAIANVTLQSGEMAVVHLDASRAVAVDGHIAVP
jgi:phosphohistidine phosphatase SixA